MPITLFTFLVAQFHIWMSSDSHVPCTDASPPKNAGMNVSKTAREKNAVNNVL